jgi:hypothetical protein
MFWASRRSVEVRSGSRAEELTVSTTSLLHPWELTYGRWFEPPPIQWTPVAGSSSQEVFDGKTSETIVYGRL